jgi:carboxypeptidase Q
MTAMPPGDFDVTSPALRRAMEQDWRVLCTDIGERRAGSAAELRAARHIRDRWAALGLADAHLESFPCRSLKRAQTEVRVRDGQRWRRVPAATLVGAPSTPGGRTVEGELVWLEMPEGARHLKPGSLRGRVLALFGPLPVSVRAHQQLVAARPLAVIHVDERLPFSWVKSDGIYPFWARRYGMPPTLTVPYLEAWRWRVAGLRRVRVRVDADLVASRSHNVVAELPGRDPRLPALVVAAHHDTQCANVGADDNASGVVCLLALARLLAGRRLRRTIRFLSFGTEEQLSVGSAAYVRQHAISSADTGLVFNFDSVASPLGHHGMWVAGEPRLERHALRAFAAHGLDVQVQREISPFFDQFPFNRAGVPSLGFYRQNFPGGRWQHHSPHDNLDNVSVDVLRQLLGAVTPLLVSLANRRRWPFAARLPARQHAVALRLGRELFGA